VSTRAWLLPMPVGILLPVAEWMLRQRETHRGTRSHADLFVGVFQWWPSGPGRSGILQANVSHEFFFQEPHLYTCVFQFHPSVPFPAPAPWEVPACGTHMRRLFRWPRRDSADGSMRFSIGSATTSGAGDQDGGPTSSSVDDTTSTSKFPSPVGLAKSGSGGARGDNTSFLSDFESKHGSDASERGDRGPDSSFEDWEGAGTPAVTPTTAGDDPTPRGARSAPRTPPLLVYVQRCTLLVALHGGSCRGGGCVYGGGFPRFPRCHHFCKLFPRDSIPG
jgi:hypothetical protein